MKKYVPKIARKIAPAAKPAQALLQPKRNNNTFFQHTKTPPSFSKTEIKPQRKPAFFNSELSSAPVKKTTAVNPVKNTLQRASSYQDNVIKIAQDKKGKIEAKSYENNAFGPANNLQQHAVKRKGYEHLLEIFHTSAPGIWQDNQVIYDNTVGQRSIPHWCGIFALYAAKKAGAGVGTWSIGKSVPTISGFKPSRSPKKGDIGIIKKHNHHFLVNEISGDGKEVKTIDGNSGMRSEVVENKRQTKDILGFYRPDNMGLQTKLTVGAPNDKYEREADAVADKVAAGKASDSATSSSLKQLQKKCDSCKENKILQLKRGNLPPPVQAGTKKKYHLIQRDPAKEKVNADLGQIKETLEQTRSGGMHLPRSVQEEFGSKMGADFSGVRIHTGEKAENMNRQLSARAFTYGNNIYFGQGNYNPDNYTGRHLLAHELTHTIQQGAAPVVQRSLERPYAHAPPAIQKSGQEDEGFIESEIWSLLGNFVPQTLLQVLRDIRHQGLFNYIKAKVMDGVTSVFRLFNIDPKIIEHAQQLFTQLAPIATDVINGLKKNDCKPLFAALTKLKDFLNKIIGDAWQKISQKLDPVVKYLDDLWQTYAAPVIDKIKAFASTVWEKFKDLASKAWTLFKDHVKNQIGLISTAWSKLKGWLGIADTDTSGEEGFTDWIKRKLGEVWESIKERLKPIIEPVKKVIKVVNDLLPWNFIIALKEKVLKYLEDMGKMADTMDAEEDGVANQQVSLRNTILPAVKMRVVQLSNAVINAGAWIGEKVEAVVTGVTNMISSVSSVELLSSVVNFIKPLETKIKEMGTWIKEKVTSLFDFIGKNILLINKFIEPVLNMLQKIVATASNILGKIGEFILGPFLLVPKCIRDPIMDWFIEKILKQIPLLSSILEIPNIWGKIKQTALHILKAVFVDGNIRKALWIFYSQLLKVFNIPPKLVTGILRKAAAVFGDIIRKPVDFLKNLVLSIKEGFGLFFDNIGTHMFNGFKKWLFSEVTSAGVKLPKTWDFQGIFGFVCDLFDLNLERFLKRMEKNPKIGKPIVDKIRTAVALFERALPWIKKLIEKGPAGMWQEFKEKLANFDFVGFIIEQAVSYITQKIVAKVTMWLISLADVSGITPIINTIILIYDSIVAFFKYLKEMLMVIDKVFDSLGLVIAGAIPAAGKLVEEALDRILPIAIGFGAQIAGLGNLSTKIKDMLVKINEEIDKAIDKIIDAAVNALLSAWNSIKGFFGDLRDRFLGWWNALVRFTGSDNKPHKIYYQGDENGAVMYIESAKKTWTEFLNEYMVVPANATNDERDKINGDRTKADNQIKEIEKAKATPIPSAPAGASEADQKKFKRDEEGKKKRAVESEIEKLAPILKDYFGKGAAKNEVKGVEPQGNFSKKSVGTELNHEAKKKGSSPDGTSPNPYDKLDNRSVNGSPGEPYFIRGHMINNNLGGPGKWHNMTPLPRSANGRFEVEIESVLKRAVESGATINVEVRAEYTYPKINKDAQIDAIPGITDPQKEKLKDIINNEDSVPEKIHVSAEILQWVNNKWESQNPKREITLPSPFEVKLDRNLMPGHKLGENGYTLSDTDKFNPVNINCGDVNEYKRLFPVTDAQGATKASAIRQKLLDRPSSAGWGTHETLKAEIGSIVTTAVVDDWKTNDKILLGDVPAGFFPPPVNINCGDINEYKRLFPPAIAMTKATFLRDKLLARKQKVGWGIFNTLENEVKSGIDATTLNDWKNNIGKRITFGEVPAGFFPASATGSTSP